MTMSTPELDRRCAAAREAWFAGRQDSARMVWQECADAGHARSMYHVGICARDDGDTAGARIWLKRAADGGDAEAMSVMGTLAHEAGDGPAARRWFMRAADSGWGQAAWNLSVIEGEANPAAQAAAFARAVELGYPPALLNESVYAEERGETERSRELLQRAVDADLPEAKYRLGVVLFTAGNRSEPYEIFSQLAEGGNASADGFCGVISFDIGELDVAVTHLRRALASPDALGDQRVTLKGLLASTLVAQGNLDEGGRVMLELYQEGTPQVLAAFEQEGGASRAILGLHLALTGDDDAAQGHLERAVELGSVEASLWLAQYFGSSPTLAPAVGRSAGPALPARTFAVGAQASSSGARFCSHCGAPFSGDQRFCSQCGALREPGPTGPWLKGSATL